MARNAAEQREEEQKRINWQNRQREGGQEQGSNKDWVNPKRISRRERMDRRLERAGLLNYQTQGLSQAEIAARYANANIRLADNSTWYRDNYGGTRPDPLAPPQVPIDIPQPQRAGGASTLGQPAVPLSPDERKRTFGVSPDERSQINYVPAANGLVIKEKYSTVWLNGDPSVAASQKDPNAPLFASMEQVKSGQANWGDVAVDERKKLLSDPNFYKRNEITKYEPWMQQQILADPNFQWEKLPKWQKWYYELSSSPAGMGAAQGAAMGVVGGPVGGATGAALGSVLGWAAGKSGYDPTKEFWDQENLISGGFGLMNFLAEQAEKTAGMGFQIANAAADPNKQVKDVLNRESWDAGANFFEVITPAYIDSMNQGKGELGWDDLLKVVPTVWVTAKIGDVILHPEKYPGEELYLGADAPVQLDKTWVERIDKAREEIKAGRPYREVMLDMQTGVVAQMGDMAGQAIADPLNFMPRMETKIGAKIAEAGGNKVAAQALSQSEGLTEAGRRYRNLVQTGEALKIDPKFQVDQMGAFSRWVAGVNKQGQVRMGSLLPTEAGLLEPVKDKSGFVKSMAEQTPHSRAQTGAGMFYENVSALLTMFTDPHEAGKYLKALSNNDMNTWAEMGTRFAESPEFYTVLPALKDFNAGKLDAIVGQWDLSLNNRDALTRIADILGEEPGKWLDDTAKRGTYEQDFARLQKKAATSDSPEAKAILKDIETGRITPEFLKQTVDLFTGEGKLPWHPGQWKAMMLDTLGTHFDEWVTQRLMLDKSPEVVSAFFRTTALMKQAQSILLLGGSPGYAITNGLSNMVNRAVTGIYGYMTPNQINTFLKRFGVTPARMEEGVGIGGQVEGAAGSSKVKTEAMTKAMRGKGALTTAKDSLAKISRGMPMSKLSSMFEKVEGQQGFAIAMKQFWSQSWRRGIGFKTMSPELVTAIQSMGVSPDRIYAAIEAGMNQAEIERALMGRAEGVQARSLIHDAAQKTGLSASQAADLLEKVGVLDTLDTYLKGQTTQEGVQAAFNRANKVAQDWVDMQTGEDLKAIAESVRQRVGLEGAASGLDVIQKAQGEFFDTWMEHLFEFGDVFENLKYLDDQMMRDKAIDLAYENSDGRFRRLFARTDASYKGIFEAWGLSGNPEVMKVLAAFGEIDVEMKGAYDFMRDTRKGIREKYKGDYDNPAMWDEIRAGQERISKRFEQAFEKKKAAEVKMGASLANIYESLYGPAAGEAARLWWQDVVEFNGEIVKREADFRKSLEGMTKEQREAAKNKYYSETKILLIAEADRINGDGIARLERVIKRGKGGQGTAEGGPQTPPPTPPEAGTVPSDIPQTPDQQSVRVIAEAEGKQKQSQQERVEEFNALMAAAEQRKAVDARESAERVSVVWDVAEEYWGRGANYSREILQDSYALLAALKKPEYGGIPDLKGLNDPRLTPEIMRQVMESRKAAKEAAGNEAVARTFSEPEQKVRKFDVTQIDQDTTLLRAIALHGGLDLNIARDLTGEKRPKSAPGVFTKKGIGVNEMARLLADDGYPIDVNDPNDIGGVRQTAELISRARAGNKVYPKGHDFTKDLAAAEAAYIEGFDFDTVAEIDPALWQTEFMDVAARGDLNRMYELLGAYPETLEPAALAEYSRIADETGARVEAEARDLEVAGHLTRAEEAIAAAETKAEAVTTRQLLKEKFAEAFGLDETQAAAWMELSDSVGSWYAKMTGESADAFYARYYGDVVKVEGEGGREAIEGLQQAYNRIEVANRQMTPADAENYARMLVRAGEQEFRSAIRNEPNKADRIAILDAAHEIDPKLAESVARGEMDVLFQGYINDASLEMAREYYKAKQLHPEWIEKAIKEFGLTDNPREAGYILPDGKFLDLSGKNKGGREGSRNLDHREIWKGMSEEARKTARDSGLNEMRMFAQGTNSLRFSIDPAEVYVQTFSSVPSPEQVGAILKAAAGKNLLFDITDASGGTLVSERIRRVTPEKILDFVERTQKIFESKESAKKISSLFQNVKGAVTFDAEGIKATIHAFEAGDFTTLVHENGHVFRRMLADVAERTNNKYIKADLATIEEWAGAKDGKWDRAAEEKFARGFERYITEGKAPTPALVKAFESFKNWMLEVYKAITGSAIDVRLSEDVRQVFDRMLGADERQATGMDGANFRVGDRAYYSSGQWNVSDILDDGRVRLVNENGDVAETQANQLQALKKATFDIDMEASRIQAEETRTALFANDSFAENLRKIKEAKAARNSGEALFQEADQPFGAYDAASKFHPQSETMDQGWAQHVRPLMDAMQEGALSQVSEVKLDGARDMSPEGQKMLRGYMKQVQGEMASTKLATVRWGEKQRDFALLNYNKRYGADRVMEAGYPYQFYYTRSMMTYAARALDKPALYANYARLRMQQDRYERDIPERLRGKIKINAPWLPEWMGGGLYIDPITNLFFPANVLRPFERAQQDKNYQVIEAERILQEWAQDGQYSQSQIAEAAQSQSGTVWERAFEEAQIRRQSEMANPLDFFSTMFGPAWYLSTPLNLAGIKTPFSKGDPSKVSPLPLGNTARALDTVTEGTWAEPLGNLFGIIGKAEDWGREKVGLPTRGEYGEYYTKRQIANLVAEGKYSPEEASLAMIEQSGPIWDEAAKRVDMELAMRVPGAGALYGLLHEGDPRSILPSLFGAGLLPAGELEYRGMKEEWNEAWKKADAGDTQAITAFFEEHPEYEAYLAKGKDGDELLKSFLIGQVWDGYMELGKTNQKQARADMGELFQQSFLDKETRSYDALDIETLTLWARMLNQKVPTPALPAGGTATPQGNVPQLNLYDPAVTAITDQFFDDRTKKFPNYYEQQQGYYALPKSERTSYLLQNPELKAYWDWKRDWYDSYPQYKPIFNGEAFKSVDTSNWPPGLEDYVTSYAYTGRSLPSGARKALEQVWIMEGQPMDSFETWLNSQVVPGIMYGGGNEE